MLGLPRNVVVALVALTLSVLYTVVDLNTQYVSGGKGLRSESVLFFGFDTYWMSLLISPVKKSDQLAVLQKSNVDNPLVLELSLDNLFGQNLFTVSGNTRSWRLGGYGIETISLSPNGPGSFEPTPLLPYLLRYEIVSAGSFSGYDVEISFSGRRVNQQGWNIVYDLLFIGASLGLLIIVLLINYVKSLLGKRANLS